MSTMIRTTACCGLREINDLTDGPVEVLRAVGINRYYVGNSCGLYLFTDATNEGNGRKLHNYIVKNALGKLVRSDTVYNPNSENNIRAWLWTPNMNFRRWYKKHKSWN